MEKVIDVIMGGFDDGRMPGVQQYDVGSRVFVCRLWERPDVPYVMAENAMASTVFDWRGAPPSNEYKQQIVDRSKVRVVVPAEAMKRSGPVDMQLTIRQNGTEERSPILCFPVWKSLLAGEQNYPEPVRVLDDLINRTNETAERVEQLQIDASGLAGDSNKLGGKPPEYYLPAVNLLDNSNFEIAQAGYGGLHGNTKYAADRWQANNHDGTTYQRTSGGLTVTSSAAYEGQIMQVVADSAALVGKTLTYAVKGLSEFGKLGMLAYCYDANDNIVQKNFLEPNFSELTVRTITFTVPANTAKIRCYINNRVADTYTVEWAALYEGPYTDDTLPPYVPRLYAVELLECQRYCIAYETNSTYETVLATGYTDSSFARFSIDLAVPMRIDNPTISADSGIVFGVRSNGSYKQAGSVTIQKALGKKLYLQANGAFESGHVACLVYYTDVDTKKRIIISADL